MRMDSTLRFERKTYSVSELASGFKKSLQIDPEYQRAAKWTVTQQQRFVDSMLRGYPVPPLFLHRKVEKDLDGRENRVLFIVDGQQRLRALSAYRAGAFALPTLDGRGKLRVPVSVLGLSAPWAGKRFEDLPLELQAHLDALVLDVYIVDGAVHPDVVRDLFIRLQGGVPLSPQQVRDAWPGDVPEVIAGVAGKRERAGRRPLFTDLIHLGGARANLEEMDEEDRDDYETCRWVAAQFLQVFLERHENPLEFPAITSRALDELYRERVSLKGSEEARSFEKLAERTEKVVKHVFKLVPSLPAKLKKLNTLALFAFLHDLSRRSDVVLERASLEILGAHLVAEEEHLRKEKPKRPSSAKGLTDYYSPARKRPLLSPGRLGDVAEVRRMEDRPQERWI